MSANAFRIWFLCTLLVVGLMPMPAAGAAHGCCGGGLSDPVAKAMVQDVPSCCQGESITAAPCGDPAETPDDHDGGCDGCSDGGPCGCHHPGPVPAVRTPSLHLTLVAPAAAIAVPQRQWTPGDATDSLLRPPRR
jgi:hypothetical protein